MDLLVQNSGPSQWKFKKSAQSFWANEEDRGIIKLWVPVLFTAQCYLPPKKRYINIFFYMYFLIKNESSEVLDIFWHKCKSIHGNNVCGTQNWILLGLERSAEVLMKTLLVRTRTFDRSSHFYQNSCCPRRDSWHTHTHTHTHAQRQSRAFSKLRQDRRRGTFDCEL